MRSLAQGRLWRSPSRFVDLDGSWQAHFDDFLISVRGFLRTVPTLLALTCTFLCIASVSTKFRPPGQHWRHEFLYTHRMVQDGGHANVSVARSNRSGTDISSRAHSVTVLKSATQPASNRSTAEELFPPIELQRMPVPADSSMRLQYAKLATLYLSPFAQKGKKISRKSYMTPFLYQPGVCDGCFLLQVKNGTLYVYDPRGVRAVMAEFRELRMREAIHWVKSAVARGVVDNTEFVFSTTDGVPTTSRNHSYRMPEPDVRRPIFSVVRCNVSDSVPFPMVLADVMRRGLGGRYWKQSSGLLRDWDNAVRNASRLDGREVPWLEKVSKAVFRGSIRVSALFKDSDLFDKLCDAAGRTGLRYKAIKHIEVLRNFDMLTGQRRRIWPLSASWFASKTEPILDVRVSGTCGSRIYANDGLPMEMQNRYKYVIHAEGNSFWADRLLIQLFGSSAIIKQSTPCGMFFEPLLRPYTHYIPVDFSFRQLVRQTMWARANDDKVLGIVRCARKFASEYLSVAGVQTYADELLVQYTSLLADRNIKIERGAMQLYP